jgi:hypothetical protein
MGLYVICEFDDLQMYLEEVLTEPCLLDLHIVIALMPE